MPDSFQPEWDFFFSSRRRHTRCSRDWSSDVCSSDLLGALLATAKDYSGTPHAGIPFDRPTGTRAAACSHKFAFKIVLSLVFVLFSLAIESVAQTPSGPVNISGQNGTVIDGVHITNPNGDCLTITNSTNITVRRSEIGPCGGHGINISGGGTINIYDSYIHPEKPLSTRSEEYTSELQSRLHLVCR